MDRESLAPTTSPPRVKVSKNIGQHNAATDCPQTMEDTWLPEYF